MKRKRYSSEEIIRKLREAEQLVAGGESVAAVCQKLEISQATFGRWKVSGEWNASCRRSRRWEDAVHEHGGSGMGEVGADH